MVNQSQLKSNKFGLIGLALSLGGGVLGVVALLSVYSIFCFEPSKVTLVVIIGGVSISIIGLGLSIAGLLKSPRELAVLGVFTSVVSSGLCLLALIIGLLSPLIVTSRQIEESISIDGNIETTIRKTKIITDGEVVSEKIDTVRLVVNANSN